MHLTVKSAKYSAIPDNEALLISDIIHPLTKDGDAIFGLIRILGKPNNTRIRLAETIEDRLFRFKETLGGDVNVARRFEQLLQAMNEDIANVTREEKTIPLSDFHVVIGVISENQIFVSGVGNLSTVFMHRSAKQRYVIYELEDQFKGNEDITWDKLFISVLDGELHYGDIFYIATRVSPREINLGEIQDILVKLPPAGALKHIHQHLSSNTAYGAVCFQVNEKTESGAPKKINPLSSIKQLDETQEQTEILLGSQKPDFAKWLMNFTNPILKKLSTPGASGTKSIFKNILRTIIKLLSVIIMGIVIAISVLFKIIKKGLKHSPTAYQAIKDMLVKLPIAKQKVTNKITELNALPPKKKYAGLGIIAVILILAGTFTVIGITKSVKKQDTLFENMLTRIVEKKDAAEASLIYDNTNQARELLDEAIALLNSLPAEKKSQEERITEIRAELATVMLAIQGIVPIELSTIATLTDAECVTSVQITELIYCLTADAQLYRLNELDKTYKLEQTVNGSIGTIILAVARESDFIFIDSNKSLGVANIANKTLNPVISGVNSLSSIEDMVEYNDNIYVLSAVDKQIIKMRPRGDGYEAGTNWISSLNSNLDDARALAIDGDIYVLKADQIIKFSSGIEQTFAFEELDPALTDALDIWTSIDSQYIYILDRGEGRIIVYDKTGKIVTQYTNDEIKNGMELIIREDKKTIIIMTPTKALSFSASHLLN